MKRDFDRCLLTSHNAIQMFSDFWLPHMLLGMCHYGLAQYPEAIQAFRKSLEMNPLSTFSQAGLAESLAGAGRKADALKALEDLKAMKKNTYVSPGYVALVHRALHDDQQEFEWLEKGYADQTEWLLWLKFEPTFDDQRNDPRFQELVRKVGI